MTGDLLTLILTAGTFVAGALAIDAMRPAPVPVRADDRDARDASESDSDEST